MRRPPSLALRLVLLFGVVAALVFSGFGWFIDRSIEHHFRAEDNAELRVVIQAVSQALSIRDTKGHSQSLKQRFQDILVGHHSAVLQVVDRDGQIIFTSPGAPDLSILSASHDCESTLVHWSENPHTYRVVTGHADKTAATKTDSGSYTIRAAVAIDYHLHFLSGFRRTLWLMIISAIIVTGLMGCFAVRQGHLPLRDIVSQIRQISANQLNTRLDPARVPRELTDLADSFNAMLQRMEEDFQRLSYFSADIAHELRTPVTNLLTQTQVALSQQRNANEYREILYSNIEEYERMAQMISDMLFLAKTDNRLFDLETVEIDLATAMQDLFDYYEAWAEERGVSLTLEGQAIIQGDKLMIRRALSNLLSNAIRHTPYGQTVSVKLNKTTNQGISITVENPGPTIAADQIPKLFDRFYRIDPSRQRNSEEGAGLGLSIVKSIIELHNGSVQVRSNDERTQFQIILPVL